MSKPILYLFNGKVARVGSVAIGYMPKVYTVTLDTVTHGYISATPMSGTSGTTIILSNTPDSGYVLDYYTLNGVAIVGNTFSMPAENVTVGAVFKVDEQYTIIQSKESTEVYREILSTSSASTNVIIPSVSTDLNYIVVVMDVKLRSGGSGGWSRVELKDANNNNMAYIMLHNGHFPSFISPSWVGTGWTTAEGAPTVSSYTNSTYVYETCPSEFFENTYSSFRFVLDRANFTMYVYINDKLLGTERGMMITLPMSKFTLWAGGAYNTSASMKNYGIAATNSLDWALSW